MNEWLPGDPFPNGDGTYTVHLCKECVVGLEEHYPYTFPREKLKIVVERDAMWCDNMVVTADDEARRKAKDSGKYPYYKR